MKIIGFSYYLFIRSLKKSLTFKFPCDVTMNIDKDILVYTYIPSFLVVTAVISVVPALSYLAYSFTGDESISTIVISVWGLAYTIFSIPSGILHQYFKKPYLLIIYGIIAMIFAGILFFSKSPILFIISRLLIGISESLVFVGFIGIIISRNPELGGATPALGRFFSLTGIALFVGPSIGSFFIVNRIINYLFYLYLILLAISLVLLVRKSMRMHGIFTGISIPIKKSVFSLFSVFPLIMVITIGALDGSFQSRSVIWFIQLGVGAGSAGYLISVYYISAIISQLLIPLLSEKTNLSTGFLISLIYGVSSLILISSVYLIDNTYYIIFLISFMLGMGIGLISPYGTEQTAKLFGDNYLIGSGFANTIWSLGYFIVPTLFAFFNTYYLSELFTVTILQIISFVGGLIFIKHYK